MSTPHIEGTITTADGTSVRFLIGPDGYRQWGWTGPTGAHHETLAANVSLLTALEEAANRVNFFEGAPTPYEQEADQR